MNLATGYIEPSSAAAPAGQRFQFKRHGYFVTDLKDHAASKAVFNRLTGMKDSWGEVVELRRD